MRKSSGKLVMEGRSWWWKEEPAVQEFCQFRRVQKLQDNGPIIPQMNTPGAASPAPFCPWSMSLCTALAGSCSAALDDFCTLQTSFWKFEGGGNLCLVKMWLAGEHIQHSPKNPPLFPACLTILHLLITPKLAFQASSLPSNSLGSGRTWPWSVVWHVKIRPWEISSSTEKKSNFYSQTSQK